MSKVFCASRKRKPQPSGYNTLAISTQLLFRFPLTEKKDMQNTYNITPKDQQETKNCNTIHDE